MATIAACRSTRALCRSSRHFPIEKASCFDAQAANYFRRVGSGGPIKTAFKAACRRAGITDFHPHDCRHTWATWHYAANRNLPALMELGGWRSEKMVLRYAHVEHLAESIAALPWANSRQREKKKAG
jgi:integrase